MGNELTMSVSSKIGPKGEKKIYVRFSDDTRSAEICSPAMDVIKNVGFTEEEISQLKDYIKSESKTIEDLASTVSPLKAFMGGK
ncbi:MAG: hypothetical protein K6G57_00570 [Lachnospiraceae bacterium]|nr:hypothetical protein [Lachnospiraceae bacterium]